MKNTNPKLTLLVQVYKPDERFIDCIKSIQNQTDLNFKCVIFKHGNYESEIFDTAVALVNADERFSVHIKEINEGVANGRTAIVSHCKTDYFARVDGDDIIEKNYVLKINQLIAVGYDLILIKNRIPSKWQAKRWSKYEVKHNMTNGILSVGNAPYTQVMQKNLFVPFPSSLPEDTNSTYYYISAASKYIVSDVEWQYFSTISSKKSRKKMKQSWYEGQIVSGNYWTDKIKKYLTDIEWHAKWLNNNQIIPPVFKHLMNKLVEFKRGEK